MAPPAPPPPRPLSAGLRSSSTSMAGQGDLHRSLPGYQPQEAPKRIQISDPRDLMFQVRPPNNPIDDDPPPHSIVLENKAYLDARTNSSTAYGCTAGGHPIKVTFWIAHPPRVSYFTVHLPTQPTTALAELPRILCTHGDLVLLRIAICPRKFLSFPQYNEYIIYRASTRELHVLPSPPTRVFSDLQVGLLSCRSIEHPRFFVAALSSDRRRGRGHYNLELFDSEAGSWSTKPMHVESSQKEYCSFTCTTKVITIGGKHGSVAWVDLCHGILICDMIKGNDTLRYIRLPLLLATNKMPRGASCDRDIAIFNGTIKYFEMCVHAQAGSRVGSTYTSQDWEAAAWTWMDPEKDWHKDCNFKASELLVDKSTYKLLPKLMHHDEVTKTIPVLSRLHTGHPALSLHQDDVVYIQAKVDHLDNKAWMLAVDMRAKSLKAVADFNAERTSSFRFTYLQSKMSEFMAKKMSNRGKHNAGTISRSGVVRSGKQVS